MRVRFTLIAVTLLGTFCARANVLSAVADESNPAVSMFRGNAARTGEMPGLGLTGDPQELWRFTTSGPGNVKSVSASGDTVYVGSVVGLHALDAATGAERWRFSA